MEKQHKPILLALCVSSLISLNASAAAITNGYFSSGDFSGWGIDTDGFAGSTNDFAVTGESASISVDHFSTPGDVFSSPINDTFFASTLFQELDLSTNPDEQIVLSFDWSFTGELVGLSAADYFLVGLNDGTGSYFGVDGELGFLIDPTTSFGASSFSAVLDFDTFANAGGWFLDFQLNVGVDDATFMTDGFGSILTVDNVQISTFQNPISVPTPSSLALMCLAVAGLCYRKTVNNKEV